jgi:hypothetical protein
VKRPSEREEERVGRLEGKGRGFVLGRGRKRRKGEKWLSSGKEEKKRVRTREKVKGWFQK